MFKKISTLALGVMLMGSTQVQAAFPLNGGDLFLAGFSLANIYKDDLAKKVGVKSAKESYMGLAVAAIPFVYYNLYQDLINKKRDGKTIRGALSSLAPSLTTMRSPNKWGAAIKSANPGATFGSLITLSTAALLADQAYGVYKAKSGK